MGAPERATILVVDDIPENIDILEAILHQEYRIKVATRGETALEIARADPPPDMILLDIMMPGMDGFEVCRQLKQDGAGAATPVIFVTAKDEVADEARGFGVGAVDYITKPIDPHIVKARVRAHLELKRAREAAELQNQILRENARLREEVESINRHDLKNPLTVILAVPGMLEQEPNITATQRTLLLLIRDAGHRMLEMINRSIDLLKMETGTYEAHPAPVDAIAVVRQIVAAAESANTDKNVSISLSANGKPPGARDSFFVSAEELLLYSMLANLVRNAVEASPPGGQVLIAFSAGEAGVIAIHNAGAIPVKVRGKFFQKYATAGKQGGTGLGAYSAKLIATTLGGTIGFDTAEETGTTITVTLPLAQGLRTEDKT